MAILVSLLTPFGAYLAAEHIGASGILAAVAAGIVMSQVDFRSPALATTRVQRTAVWDAVQFTLNGIMFVLLGEQLPGILRRAIDSVGQSGHQSPWWLLAYALAINLMLALLRLAWVWVSLRLDAFAARRRGEKPAEPSWRLVVATSLAGVRGAITLAGVLTLPLVLADGRAFPARDLVIFLAAAVILVSLLAASIGLPRLLVGLEVPPEPDAQREEDVARRAAARAALAAIERAQHELPGIGPDVLASAAVRVMALYQRRLEGDQDRVAAGELRKADDAERALRIAALRAEREAIFALARERRVSDDIARRLARDIDLAEARYR